MISQVLSDSWVDDYGEPFQSYLKAAYDPQFGIVAINNAMMINELANDRPVLYGNRSHAMVAVEIVYYDTPMGPNVQQVGVLDPAPGAPNFHYLSMVEMIPVHQGGQMMYLAAVDVS